MEVKHGWATTPIVCDICGHKIQLVYETDIIIDDAQKEMWKMPTNLEPCSNCGANSFTFVDFETK